ncbi:MAG: hypothetical protein ACP5F8_03140 [Candidatus Aenigmatarchaeota archaeon]
MKGQEKKVIDEFAFVLLASLIFIGIMLVYWTTPSELPPSLEPREIKVSSLPEKTKSITFKISGNLTSVLLEANGTISNLVSFSENNFAVYGEKEVKLSIKAPSSYGTYSGYIIAKGKGGEDAIKLTLSVVPSLSLSSRSIPIEDFKISFYEKEKSLDLKENFEVKKSLFSSLSAKLVFQPEREVESAKLKLYIEDVSGSGLLVIKMNGRVIFEDRASEGILEIPLNVSEIKEINFITIEVENKGLNFLASTSYHFYQAKIIVTYKSIPFYYDLELSQNEIDNFNSLEFSSIVLQQNYPTLEIRFNNQKVFIGKIPIASFRISFSKDLMGNDLIVLPKNKISFYLITEGEISFSNNILRIYTYS